MKIKVNYKPRGKILLTGRGEVLPMGFIELTKEEISSPEINPYIGKYLHEEGVPFDKPAEVITKADATKPEVRGEQSGVVVEAPVNKTAEEVKVAEEEEKDKETVAVTSHEMEGGAAVQTIEEVSKKEVEALVAKLKSSPWKKREKVVTEITDKNLLKAILPEFEGKTGEFIQAQIKSLK